MAFGNLAATDILNLFKYWMINVAISLARWAQILHCFLSERVKPGTRSRQAGGGACRA